MTNTVTIKGQLLTAKYISSFILISVLAFGALCSFYYFNGYDLVFHLSSGGISKEMSIMFSVVFSAIIAAYIAYRYNISHFNTIIKLSLNDEDLEVIYNNEKVIIKLKNITHLFFYKKFQAWSNITVQTDQQNIKINLGNLFFGIYNPAVDDFFALIKSSLTTKYNLQYEAGHSFKGKQILKFTNGQQNKHTIKFLTVVFGSLIVAISIIFIFTNFYFSNKGSNTNYNYSIYRNNYTTDGKNHYVNDIQFPLEVDNIFWGTTTADLKQLTVLQKPSDVRHHILFSDKKTLYYYDEQRKNFLSAENIVDLVPFSESVFTDDNHIYYTETKPLQTRANGIYGYQTFIFKTNLKKSEMIILHQLRDATVYKNRKNYYISINDDPISLYKIDNFSVFRKDVINNNLIHINNYKGFITIKDPFLVLKISTRKI